MGDTPLRFAAIVLGLLAGRLCVWVASWLPAVLAEQWQRDARELLGANAVPTGGRQSAGNPGSDVWKVQVTCAALSLVVSVVFGATPQALFALLLTWWLLALSLIDKEHYLLPDALVMPGLWSGLMLNSLEVFTTLQEALWGCVIGYLSLWSVCYMTKFMTGREHLGKGDFKLLALIGAWGGWQILPWTVGCALLLASVASGYLSVRGRLLRNSTIPFGPFLSMAGWMGLLATHQCQIVIMLGGSAIFDRPI
ncbi:prepilin peptidase [Pseudomonas monteilii]|nr:prepilin peptidase [Pseudomonas monteilii]